MNWKQKTVLWLFGLVCVIVGSILLAVNVVLGVSFWSLGIALFGMIVVDTLRKAWEVSYERA